MLLDLGSGIAGANPPVGDEAPLSPLLGLLLLISKAGAC